MKRLIILIAFALALVACGEAAGGYTYTPAYEPPTLRPPQAATVAESYVSLQVTQQAAEAQLASDNADFSATSTAVAGQIAILQFEATQTAAAATASYEATTWSATMTQDATNAFGALQATNAEATRVQSSINLQVAQDNADAEAAQLETERLEMTNTYNAWVGRIWLGAMGIVVLLAAVFAAYWLRLYSLRVRDALGQPMWYDGRQLVRAYGDETTIALAAAARDVQVAKQLNGQVIIRHAPAALPAPVVDAEQAMLDAPDVPLPDWQEFVNWPGWSTGRLLLGHSLDDALAIDPEHDPHVMVAGTSGSGKTRHGLTILGAAALRLGWHVVALNRAGSDFAPLAGHPAMHIFDGPQYPLAVLLAAAAEVDRRNEMLRAAGATTWSRLGANADPRVLVMVDELVALTQSAAEQEQATAIWRAVVHVTSAGRKCGVHLAFATTDPTHKTLGRLGLVTRDNCARVAFRLRSNQAIVPGGMALDLAARRFLALTSAGNAPQPGAAFAPEDDELAAYIRSLASARPVDALPAFLGEQNLLDRPVNTPGRGVAAQVRVALEANPRLSKRKLCLQVLGQPYAGSFAEQLDRALAADGWQCVDGEWRRATTTATTLALAGAAAKG